MCPTLRGCDYIAMLVVAGLVVQGNAYDDDEEYGDVDDGGDEGALY